MKGLVTHPQWLDFLQWIEKEREQGLSVLTFTENENDLYRVQGALKLMVKIKGLKEKVLREEM